MAGGKQSKRNVNIAERRSRALELRKMGASYRAIASTIQKEMGVARYSQSTAHDDVSAALQELREQTSLNAQEYVRLELERLDIAMVLS